MKKKTVVFLILVSISLPVLADMKAPLQFTPKKLLKPFFQIGKLRFFFSSIRSIELEGKK